MLRVLFITSASHTPSDKNLNHFQRVYFLSRETELTILARKGADFTVSAQHGTRIVRSPFSGKIGQIIYSFLWFIAGNARKVDIVLTEPSILGISGFIYKLVRGCKWAVDIWDIPIRYNSQNGLAINLRCRITRFLMKYCYRLADLFIVSILPDFELRNFQLNPEKMLLLGNAIWLDHKSIKEFALNNNTFNILCTRSLYSADMGLDTLMQSFLSLNKKIKNLSLTVVGKIPEQVKGQVKGLEGLENVQFCEFVEHKKLEKLIQSASVCVVPFKDVPDLAQTYPVKVLEYLTMGKPVVASNIEGISRMITAGKNGLLFKAGDYRDLSEKIEILYKNENLRKCLSENARQLDEVFDCVKKNRVILEKLQQIENL